MRETIPCVGDCMVPGIPGCGLYRCVWLATFLTVQGPLYNYKPNWTVVTANNSPLATYPRHTQLSCLHLEIITWTCTGTQHSLSLSWGGKAGTGAWRETVLQRYRLNCNLRPGNELSHDQSVYTQFLLIGDHLNLIHYYQ